MRTTSTPFKYQYFKVFQQVGNRQYFQLVEKKKWLAWEHAKEVVEGLGTGWFVTIINLAPDSYGCRKILPQGVMPLSFSIRVFFHRHWRFTGQQGRGGDHRLFHSTTSTHSRTLKHSFATLHVRWLSNTINRNVCVNQTATQWDLPPYWVTIWLIDWWCNVCLFVWWCNVCLVFVTAILTLKTGGFELASTITLVLQANWTSKVSKVNKPLVSLDIGQHNAMEIFAVKRNVVSETSKILLNDVFTQPDGSSEIKNIITDILNLGEFQVDDISAKIRNGKKYKEIYTNQVNLK